MAASNRMAACLVLQLLLLQAPINSCSSWELPDLMLDAEDIKDSIRARYEHWIARHGRRYNDGHEKARRFQIYRSNVQLIDSFNSMDLGYTLTDNKFADLTNAEFREMIECLGPPISNQHESKSRRETQVSIMFSLPVLIVCYISQRCTIYSLGVGFRRSWCWNIMKESIYQLQA